MNEPTTDIPPGAMWRVKAGPGHPRLEGMFYRYAGPGRYEVWSRECPQWTDTATPWSLSKFDDRDLFEVVG